MDAEVFTALRAPFPPEQIGKLPKGGVHLDYVGHADVTDRLLHADPEWSWEPMALTAEGLPALDRFGNLWIRLTVAGVTRIGVGDGKSMKECIGDALRNAAMRFGVALDLWAKGDRTFGLAGHDAPYQEQVVGGDNDKAARTPDPVDRTRITREKGDPLGAVKAEVWAAAQKAGMDRDGLAQDFAARFEGLDISAAHEATLRSYLTIVRSLPKVAAA